MDYSPLQGIKVVDMTEVQSGPSCTQMLAWLGAEVIKIERPGGDPTRTELLDLPGLDSLYYLQLNANKKSMMLNAKTPEGKQILTQLVKEADIFVENLHPGAAEALGFGWDDVHAMNPRCIYGTIKGFNAESQFANVKAFEPVAQSAGGAASTTGWWSGPDNVPTQSGAALGDSNTGMHLLIGLLAALMQRTHTGEGCYVQQSMQDAVINLCRVKLRDQLMLENMGTLHQYPQSPNVGDVVPRGGNIEGGQVVGWCYKCKGWETDPNAYVYIVLQNEAKAFALAAEALGKPEWITDPKFSTPEARNENKQAVYAGVEEFTITRDKFECVEILAKAGVPCGPVLNWKEIQNDESLYKCGTLVKLTSPKRGEYVTIGCPPKFSNFTPNITPAPALGENTDEILTGLGYTADQIAKMKADKVCG